MEDDLTFPQIIDGLPAPIATTTADGRVEFVSRQFLDYVGMSVEEIDGWQTSGAVHPDDVPRVATVWRQSLEHGEPYELEQRIRRADGTHQPAIEGSGVEPLPGQGPRIKAGEFILGYPGEAGVPLPMPQPDV